jgi:hypothetical protein
LPRLTGFLRLVAGFSIAAGTAQPALARGGGGPPVSSMTKQYCTEMVVNKGITDVQRFQAEVQKCLDNPITYPPTYK